MKDGTVIVKTPESEAVDAYIAGFPEPVRTMLDEVRRTLRAVLPDAQEAIKYGIPTYVQGENIVHFGGYAGHIGLYPGPTGITAFSEAFARYKSAKGSVQFPTSEPMPLDLIADVARFRLAEAQAKTQRKPK